MSKLDAGDRDKLPNREFASPKQRKEPLEDASHVRNGVARFDGVKDVTDAERDKALSVRLPMLPPLNTLPSGGLRQPPLRPPFSRPFDPSAYPV